MKDIFVVLCSPELLNDVSGIHDHLCDFLILWRCAKLLTDLHFGFVLNKKKKRCYSTYIDLSSSISVVNFYSYCTYFNTLQKVQPAEINSLYSFLLYIITNLDLYLKTCLFYRFKMTLTFDFEVHSLQSHVKK